jgi:hypothetical protein
MRLPGDKSPVVSARDGAQAAAVFLGFLVLAFYASGGNKVAAAIMALIPSALFLYVAYQKKRRGNIAKPEATKPGNV